MIETGRRLGHAGGVGVELILGDACEPWVLEEAHLAEAEVVELVEAEAGGVDRGHRAAARPSGG